MQNKKIFNQFVKIYPDFILVDGYFIHKNAGLFSQGFLLQKNSSHFELRSTIHPLFDNAENLYSSFSEKMVSFKKSDVKDNELMDRVRSYIDNKIPSIQQPMTIKEFHNVIKNHDDSFRKVFPSHKSILKNNALNIVYAYSLILLDRFDEAKQRLIESLEKSVNKNFDIPYINRSKSHTLYSVDLDYSQEYERPYERDAKLILKLFQEDPEKAKNQLGLWVNEKKRKMNIS